MTGRELADEMRRSQRRLRVLYTSGYTRNAIVHAGRLDPGVDVIAKPFTFEELAEKVRDVLDAGRARCALIVNADPSTWSLAATALAELEMRPEVAGSGREALNKVRASPASYDVVILDEALPDHSGESLARELRALHSNLILVLTAQENADRLRQEFSADPCIAILEGPYTADQLKETLKGFQVDCAD